MDGSARKREGALRGRTTMKRKRQEARSAASSEQFAACVSLESLNAAHAFFGALEPMRSEVYARVKYARALALHASGEGPAPAKNTKFDEPPARLTVGVPSDACTAHEDGRAGVRISVHPAASPPAVATQPVSHLRDFKNVLNKPPYAQRLLSAVGVERFDDFNAKLHAGAEKPHTLRKLPKDGAALLKGGGADSEATAQAVGQVTRALAERVAAEVKRAHGGAHAQAFARLHASAAADPAFLLKHEVTRTAFRTLLGADVPETFLL